MRILKFSALLALSLVLAVSAATIKRPLTVKSYAKQYYLEWTGTAGVLTADDMLISADTANSYGVDPFYFLYNKKVSVGEEKVFPGEKIQEKACVMVTMAGDADATTSDVYLTQASTKNGTFVKVGATAQTVTSTATTTTMELAAVPLNPFYYWKLVIDPTTATDSVEVKGVQIYPCDD